MSTNAFVADHAAFAADDAVKVPRWARKLRDRAIARFAELGVPTTRDENWKYTDVTKAIGTAFAPAGARAVSLDDVRPFLLEGAEALHRRLPGARQPRRLFAVAEQGRELLGERGHRHAAAPALASSRIQS